jgi:hypothetical protein
MGSGSDDWVYWHFFAITVDYSSSHIEFLLNDVCLANASTEYLTNLVLVPTTTGIKSYVTTDGQSTSLSWNEAPIWILGPEFYYCQTVAGLLLWGDLTRGRVCCLQLLLVLASTVILGSESRGTHDHILLSQIRDSLFRRLLQLAGLRWRYSTPPPHGITTTRIQIQSHMVHSQGQRGYLRLPDSVRGSTFLYGMHPVA